MVALTKGFRFVFPFFDNYDFALLLNCLVVLRLFWLIKKYFDFYKIKIPENKFLLLYFLASPAILLLNIKIQTDLYAGFIGFYLILELEKLRQNNFKNSLSIQKSAFLAFLFIVAISIKETIVFLVLVYALILFWEERKHLALFFKRLFPFVVFSILFLFLEFSAAYFIHDDFFYKFNLIASRPHGGSGKEYAGALASSPVPLWGFHVFSHLKVYGRMGLLGLVGFFLAFKYRKKTIAKIFLLGLLLLSILGISGRFTIERYWYLFLFSDINLFAIWMETLKAKFPKNKIIYFGILAFAIGISLFNFVFRYT